MSRAVETRQLRLARGVAARARIASVALALLWTALRSSSAAAAPSAASDSLYRAERGVMGTTFEILLYASDGARAAALFDLAFDEIERVEDMLSDYRPESELSRINAHAGREAVETDRQMFDFLGRALTYGRVTRGAFDITVGRLVDAWGFYRGSGRLPNERALADAREQVGWQRVVLDSARRTVRYSAPRLRLDPGGIGKGYALDRVVTVLRGAGVDAALLSAGTSSLHAIGAPPGHEGWTVVVPDPRDASHSLAVVRLRDQSLSTSGRDGKSFRVGGQTYSHILDPRSGRPVDGVLQVTAIAPTGMESEALTKAVFVLGADSGRLVVAGIPGASVLLVDTESHVALLSWPSVVAASPARSFSSRRDK